jgi:hypothetical protein
MKRLLKILFSFLILSFFLVPQVEAADFNVDCGDSGCTTSGLLPIFNATTDGFWYPGRNLTKTIKLKNSSSGTREMAIKGERTSGVSILENVMHISIVGGTTVIWSGSVADFYGQDKIGMGIFAPGVDFDYNFTVFMSSDADDNYQNKETVFDLTLGFWGDPISTPTPTPTPGAVLGVVLGAGVSAPVCTDTKPGVPANFAASVGPGAGQVILSWAPPSPPYTYFLIAYSDDSTTMKWGNPNVGNVTTYTVSGLGSGTYWFWLRAGNGCMPGDFVGPISPGAITGVAGAPAVAPGFLPGVLGAKEKVEEKLTQEVKAASCLDKNYVWWLPLIFEAILILGYFVWLKRRRVLSLRWIIIPLILVAISQYLHEVWGCNCATSVWCPRYWVFNLLVLIISLLFWRFLLKRK